MPTPIQTIFDFVLWLERKRTAYIIQFVIEEGHKLSRPYYYDLYYRSDWHVELPGMIYKCTAALDHNVVHRAYWLKKYKAIQKKERCRAHRRRHLSPSRV